MACLASYANDRVTHHDRSLALPAGPRSDNPRDLLFALAGLLAHNARNPYRSPHRFRAVVLPPELPRRWRDDGSQRPKGAVRAADADGDDVVPRGRRLLHVRDVDRDKRDLVLLGRSRQHLAGRRGLVVHPIR